MPKIFISYRRDTAEWIAGRIHERLTKEFGDGEVFKDDESIPPGVEFRKWIEDALTQCDTMLVVIDKPFLESRFGWIKWRKIDDPEDYVRFEIETALNRQMRVVPVLAGIFQMPNAKRFPQPLHGLVQRQAVQVRGDPYFSTDMDRLVLGLKREIPLPLLPEPLPPSRGSFVDGLFCGTGLGVFLALTGMCILSSFLSDRKATSKQQIDERASSGIPNRDNQNPPVESVKSEADPATEPEDLQSSESEAPASVDQLDERQDSKDTSPANATVTNNPPDQE
jgi:hypothetical protein